MRKQEVKTEVRRAVKEYVDQLITERRGPGRGMAVPAHALAPRSLSG